MMHWDMFEWNRFGNYTCTDTSDIFRHGEERRAAERHHEQDARKNALQLYDAVPRDQAVAFRVVCHDRRSHASNTAVRSAPCFVPRYNRGQNLRKNIAKLWNSDRQHSLLWGVQPQFGSFNHFALCNVFMQRRRLGVIIQTALSGCTTTLRIGTCDKLHGTFTEEVNWKNVPTPDVAHRLLLQWQTNWKAATLRSSLDSSK